MRTCRIYWVWAPESLSLFTNYPKIREAQLDRYKNLIDFAKDINAIALTIHPGGITTLTFPGGKKIPLFRSYPKYFFKVFKENLKTLCDYAKNKVDLCIENADYFEEPVMKAVEEFIRKKELFLVWDIAKTYNGDGNIKKSEVDFFKKNLKSIRNIHLHDATATSDHEIIGRGFVDFKSFFRTTKNLDVNYIIEVRPHFNVLKSRANLLKILSK